MVEDTKSLGSHFAFGKNWASYSKQIDDEAIESAKAGLERLVSANELAQRSFLDIGCGSGLHTLAALRLGAGEAYAVDLDPDSVATTHKTLKKFASDKKWSVKTASVFDLCPKSIGTFDIVYSWGVLHHTGDLVTAIKRAAKLVHPNGLFVIALYRRTWLDRFWVWEKRWYKDASSFGQKIARGIYHSGFRAASLVTGKLGTEGHRGMEYWHDMHDWLGGYPYEAILAPEVDELLKNQGFEKERIFARSKSIGLFGSGCDEYVYRKTDHQNKHA